MTKIFILNAPAGSGKDTLADYVCQHNSTFRKEKFANPMKQSLKRFFDLSDEEFNYYENNQDAKNTASERFFFDSWRNRNIDFSEEYAKPQFGQDIFGKLLAGRMKPNIDKNYIISDGGFSHEIVPILEQFAKKNVFVIRINREGHDFSRDSRDYIDMKQFGMHHFEIENTEIGSFLEEGTKLIETLLRTDYDYGGTR